MSLEDLPQCEVHMCTQTSRFIQMPGKRCLCILHKTCGQHGCTVEEIPPYSEVAKSFKMVDGVTKKMEIYSNKFFPPPGGILTTDWVKEVREIVMGIEKDFEKGRDERDFSCLKKIQSSIDKLEIDIKGDVTYVEYLKHKDWNAEAIHYGKMKEVDFNTHLEVDYKSKFEKANERLKNIQYDHAIENEEIKRKHEEEKKDAETRGRNSMCQRINELKEESRQQIERLKAKLVKANKDIEDLKQQNSAEVQGLKDTHKEEIKRLRLKIHELKNSNVKALQDQSKNLKAGFEAKERKLKKEIDDLKAKNKEEIDELKKIHALELDKESEKIEAYYKNDIDKLIQKNKEIKDKKKQKERSICDHYEDKIEKMIKDQGPLIADAAVKYKSESSNLKAAITQMKKDHQSAVEDFQKQLKEKDEISSQKLKQADGEKLGFKEEIRGLKIDLGAISEELKEYQAKNEGLEEFILKLKKEILNSVSRFEGVVDEKTLEELFSKIKDNMISLQTLRKYCKNQPCFNEFDLYCSILKTNKTLPWIRVIRKFLNNGYKMNNTEFSQLHEIIIGVKPHFNDQGYLCLFKGDETDDLLIYACINLRLPDLKGVLINHLTQNPKNGFDFIYYCIPSGLEWLHINTGSDKLIDIPSFFDYYVWYLCKKAVKEIRFHNCIISNSALNEILYGSADLQKGIGFINCKFEGKLRKEWGTFGRDSNPRWKFIRLTGSGGKDYWDWNEHPDQFERFIEKLSEEDSLKQNIETICMEDCGLSEEEIKKVLDKYGFDNVKNIVK